MPNTVGEKPRSKAHPKTTDHQPGRLVAGFGERPFEVASSQPWNGDRSAVPTANGTRSRAARSRTKVCQLRLRRANRIPTPARRNRTARPNDENSVVTTFRSVLV